MAQMIITMEFDNADDAEFLKERAISVLDELCLEYQRNLDTEMVMIMAEINDA